MIESDLLGPLSFLSVLVRSLGLIKEMYGIKMTIIVACCAFQRTESIAE